MGLLDWFRRGRAAAIPEELWQRTVSELPFLAALDAADRQRLRALSEAFLAEKEFTAAGGLVLSDEICVAIATQGCLPILNLGLAAYSDWIGIVVYPDEFIVPREIHDEDGVVHEFADVLSGEAWQGGPLLVSWHDVQMAGEGYNVVIHEFAHKLDMLNGEADGMPELHSGLDAAEWERVFTAAYDDFCARVDRDEETIIDPYASNDPAEFFAVFSESFFELPDVVHHEYPLVYGLLQRYYRQDPLTRHRRQSPAG